MYKSLSSCRTLCVILQTLNLQSGECSLPATLNFKNAIFTMFRIISIIFRYTVMSNVEHFLLSTAKIMVMNISLDRCDCLSICFSSTCPLFFPVHMHEQH